LKRSSRQSLVWLSAPTRSALSPPGLRRLRFPFFTINLSKSKVPPGASHLWQVFRDNDFPSGRYRWRDRRLDGSWRPNRGSEASAPRNKGASTGTPCPCQHPIQPPRKISPRDQKFLRGIKSRHPVQTEAPTRTEAHRPLNNLGPRRRNSREPNRLRRNFG